MQTWVQSLGRKILWRRKWQPTPVFLPGKSQGQRNLTGYKLGDCKESNVTECTHIHSGTWSLVPVGNRKMNRRHHGHLFNRNRGYKARNGLGGFESQTEGICVIKPRMGRRTVLYKWLPLLHPSVQFSSVAQSCPTLCDPIDCSTPGFPVHHQLPEFTQTHVHPVGDAIQPSHPLSSPSPPAPNPSQHQGLCKWVSSSPKYWSFSFSISPSNEYLGLISFRMDWLDLLAVQGTLKNLPQHHSSKASVLQCSAFFIVQLSHPYMTTGKTIAVTRQTFVGKVMSLLSICCLGWS